MAGAQRDDRYPGRAAPAATGWNQTLGEECDKSITTPQCTAGNQSGSCHDDCFCSICGDGNKDPAEECDPGSGNFSDTDPDKCRTGCCTGAAMEWLIPMSSASNQMQVTLRSRNLPVWVSPNTCGDGSFHRTRLYSECDYSAGDEGACKTAGFECSQSCICEPVCGDNIVAGAEVCDGTDGCQSGYACNDECSGAVLKKPLCGDGSRSRGNLRRTRSFWREGFECIAQGQLNACTCTPAPEIIEESAGNGVLDAGEQ